jgi:putative glutamine amidotransferase
MKPIIGIVEWPYKDEDGDLIYEVPNNIVEKISKHGGIPVGIFPTQIEDFQNKRLSEIDELTFIEKQDLIESLDRVDAIIKPGALKIYGYERYIYDYAFNKDIPYLGICAGMQMMAGYQNNKYNNVKNETDIHHSKEEYAHTLRILKDTLLYNILKEEEIMVNSRHRYHIANPGINEVNALSEDGIIEGIENRDKLFHLGVQWHPENLNDENTNKIFDEFIESAKKVKRK